MAASPWFPRIAGCFVVVAIATAACGGGDPDVAAPRTDEPPVTEATPTPEPTETAAPEEQLGCEDLLPIEDVSQAVGGEVEIGEEAYADCVWREAGAEHPILTLEHAPGQSGAFDDQVSALDVSPDEMISGVGDQAFLRGDILTFTKGDDLVTMMGELDSGALDEDEFVSLAKGVADRL